MGELKWVGDKVIISVDHESKNSHTFEGGLKIRLERDWNNLNRRETQPVNAIVVSGENIKPGSEILIHPNVTHDTNKIFNYTQLSGKVEGSDIKQYSVPIDKCYAWYDEDELCWKPLKGFDFALRVYKPYIGPIEGIDPNLVPDVLYVTTGEFKGQVVHTLKACDYEMIFQGRDGREDRIIRFRHFPGEDNDREEVIAVSEYLTDEVNEGRLIVGLSPTTAKEVTPTLTNKANDTTRGNRKSKSKAHAV
jgi:hypothetical protein